MKKINKSAEPQALSSYRENNPNGKWGEFRKHRSRRSYRTVKKIIFADQGELCAYCEVPLKDIDNSMKRLEHFHSKGDTQATTNLDLEWTNIIGVCLGGEKGNTDSESETNSDASLEPSDRLSCDAHKNRLEEGGVISKNCVGLVLNPLEIIKESLFVVNKKDGKIHPNTNNCSLYTPAHNVHQSVEELVQNTINVFNLNCTRLTKRRKMICDDFYRRVLIARSKQDVLFFENNFKMWFSSKWPSFFTTKRFLMGDFAEKKLAALNFNG
ncbi:retron system putative HNH endonuclease [Aeromonas veronii]|uniref:retron system putative HNH endonuclease n=1 Tax=Aeromonas veronii TaxID=654 RepID=UPI003BA22757